MAVPLEGDLILRPSVPNGPGAYELVDAVTLTLAFGPFSSLGDAAYRARSLARANQVRIWQEHVDDRGSVTGAPTILFDYRPETAA